MGSISTHVRKQDVTRRVRLSPPDAISRAGSTTANQKQIVTWGGPVQTLFGYSLHDVEDTEDWWLDRIHPNDRRNVIESLSRHLSPASGKASAAEFRIWRSDYRFRHVDGSYILVSDRATTTRDRNGNASCLESVIYDKEARRNERDAHAKVFKAQDHLALIAANTPSGIYMMDPQVRALFTPNQPTLTLVSRAIVSS
jgi:PAS domain-containing protein